MSISSIFNIATSGLYTSQSGIKTVSQNIANVNTPGYVRLEQQQENVNLAGQSAGVKVSSVRRAANNFLQAASISASSNYGQSNIAAQYLDDLQSVFGDPTSSSSLFSQVSSTMSSFQNAVTSPNSISIRRDIISQMQSLLSQLGSSADLVKSLQNQADEEIGATVSDINGYLKEIASLNNDITRASIIGDANGGQERLSQVVDKLSQLIDVRVDYSDGGIAKVYTNDGTFLAGYEASTLSYTQSSTGQGTYGSIGISFGNDPTIRPIETSIQSGKLRGLLDVRNNDLPQIADSIGDFGGHLADAINAVHNVTASLPAIATATGNDTGLIAADALGFTGSTTIGVVATDGTLQRKIAIDFNAGTLSVNGGAATPIGTTIGSFTNALNTALGGIGTASFTNGALKLTNTTAGNGFVFDEPTTNQSLRGDKSFAHFFGLNNLITSSQPTSFATGLKTTDAHGFTVGDDFTMRLVAPNGSVLSEKTVTIPAGNFSNIISSLNNGATGFGLYGSFSLDTSGAMKWTPNTGGEDNSLQMTEDTGIRTGTNLTFGQMFGLNQGTRMMRGSSLNVNTTIAADPKKLGLAMGDLSSVAVGSVAIGLGDSSGAEALFNALNQTQTFTSVNSSSSHRMTFNEFVSSLAGDLATRSSTAESLMESSQHLKTEADTRRSNVEGVNLDEELVKLTAYQQSYSASARLITAADDMFKALLDAV